MNDIDPDRDFNRLVVVETGVTRFIGIQREPELMDDDVEFVLDHAVGLTIKPTQHGMAPALASLDYCMYAIKGLSVKKSAWFYHPCDQEERTRDAFKTAYFTMLKLMEDDQRQVARAKGSGIVTPNADDMAQLSRLTQFGRVPK